MAQQNNAPANVQRGTTTETTGLATRQSTSRELATSGAQEAARAEIEGALVLARRFPRNNDNAYQGIIAAVKRPGLAEIASYRYPRGGSQIEGPSVYFAKEAARLWGNITYGFKVVSDDGQTRHLQGFAWDMETNAKSTAEVSFQKLVQRKAGWVEPDERDLRELTNKHGAILIRNCILDLLPRDFRDEAMAAARTTRESKIKEDMEGSRRKILAAFGSLNIPASELDAYLGKKIAQATAKDIADLREVYASVKDGHTTWGEHYAPEGEDSDDEPTDTEAALTKPRGTSGKRKAKPKGKADPKADAKTDPPKTEPAKSKAPENPDAEPDGPLADILASIARAHEPEEVDAALAPGELIDLLSGPDRQRALEAGADRKAAIKARKAGRLV